MEGTTEVGRPRIPTESCSAPAAVAGLPPPSPGPSPRCSRRLRPFPARLRSGAEGPGGQRAPMPGWRWRGTGNPPWERSGAGPAPRKAPGSVAPAPRPRFCDSQDLFSLKAKAQSGIHLGIILGDDSLSVASETRSPSPPCAGRGGIQDPPVPQHPKIPSTGNESELTSLSRPAPAAV